MTQSPEHSRDSTIASRWDLEPQYPEVTASDKEKCDAIRTWLQAAVRRHDLHGVTVELDGATPAYIAYLLVNDAYEHGDLALIKKHVREGDQPLVLGAGMGVIGSALALQAKRRVVVVDANEALAAAVARTAALNQVELEFVHGAVVPGRAEGSIEFVVSEEFWASSLREDTYKAANVIKAPILDAEALLRKHQPNVLFVDIEGAEVGLFKGLLIPEVQKLFVEIHRPSIGNQSWAEVIADIHAQGFRMVDAAGLTCYFER